MSSPTVPLGIHSHRLNTGFDFREHAFWRQWCREHEQIGKWNGDLLLGLMAIERGILTDEVHWPLGKPTDRDRRVAATVIQWLGSNVGMCFLSQALTEAGGGLIWPKMSAELRAKMERSWRSTEKKVERPLREGRHDKGYARS